jgi:hypothetical protein
MPGFSHLLGRYNQQILDNYDKGIILKVLRSFAVPGAIGIRPDGSGSGNKQDGE